MEKVYNASLDATAKWLTGLAILILLSGTVLGIWRIPFAESSVTFTTTKIALSILLIGILAGCWFYRVTGYAIDTTTLKIKRPIGDREIPFSDIRQVSVPNRKSMRPTLRTFGNGGIFGYTGYYYNTTFGSMRWYATRLGNYVVLHMADETKIVITPDDITMADEIRMQAGISTGA